MDTFELVQKKFEAMGARVKMSYVTDHWRRPTGLQVNIDNDRKGEFFELSFGDAPLEIQIVDCRPRDRHLLMLVKSGNTLDALADRENWSKLLCGHDERHWFVVGVNPVATNVDCAKVLLKPEEVIESEVRHGLKASHQHRRKNKAYIRQGEWFFVPTPELNPNWILRNEPIMRLGSSAHWVDQLYRRGGETVQVCRNRPSGLTGPQYGRLLERTPEAKNWGWVVMARNPEAYGRGRVRHGDHRTVVLNGWHRILLSQEFSPGGMTANGFLD